MRRGIKFLLTMGLIAMSFLTILQYWLPYRATTDEALVFHDLWTVLESGHLFDPVYYSGVGFQYVTSILVLTLDISVLDLDILSPIIGSLVFIQISLIGYLIAQDNQLEIDYRLAILPLLSLFVFSGFINGIIESTHKGYTFLLLFTAIYGSIIGIRRNSKSLLGIATILVSTIAIFNYLWGIVFGMIVSIILLSSPRSTHLHPAAALIPISGVAIAFYLPIISIHRAYFRGMVPIFLSGNFLSGTSTSTTEAGATTATWPMIQLLGMEFTIWYIYVIGIVLISLLSVFCGLHMLARIVIDRKIHQYQTLLFSVSVVLGPMCFFFIVTSDLATLPRILPIIGFAATIYSIYLITNGKINISATQRSKIISVLIVILLISVVLATPRMVLDSDRTGSPYDRYGEPNQVQHVQWIETYNASACPVSSSVESFVARKLIGTGLDTISDLENNSVQAHNQIYHSGADANSYCRPSSGN